MTTSFVNRLRARDASAWFELWEVFGPVLESQLAKWGRGRIGNETVRDLSQETLAALSDSIDRYDPARGARFSTWLLAIAKHTLGDEIDRRMAQKRGSGKKAASLEEAWMAQSGATSPGGEYEAAVFRAKVCAAIRAVERECEFSDFSVYQMRVLDGQSGKEVAEAIGTSEPTVSRRLSKVREMVRTRLGEIIATYSFTEEELAEPERNGLTLSPNKSEDALFDEAIAELYHREMEARRKEASETDERR
ncbi:MAG: sigma-70 family RNA polymerase sigma factor [Planctomycetota bacterium]